MAQQLFDVVITGPSMPIEAHPKLAGLGRAVRLDGRIYLPPESFERVQQLAGEELEEELRSLQLVDLGDALPGWMPAGR